jgi:TonB family protein
LAGVQAKVWAVWARQVRLASATPVEVEFSIADDGSLVGLPVATPSGNTLVDLAAVRAIVSAAPFAPLPRDMESRLLTIRALFKPES